MSEYIDLGRDPKRLEPNGIENKKNYPCLYIDDTSVLKGMKIGEEGEATIKYMITGSGLEVRGISFGKEAETKNQQEDMENDD